MMQVNVESLLFANSKLESLFDSNPPSCTTYSANLTDYAVFLVDVLANPYIIVCIRYESFQRYPSHRKDCSSRRALIYFKDLRV